MASDFLFEPPSDEEIEYEHNDSKDDSSEENGEAKNNTVNEEEDEISISPAKKNKKSKHSPWDFSSYSQSVADEHARRCTTSIDFKISPDFLQQRSAPASSPPIPTSDHDHDHDSDS